MDVEMVFNELSAESPAQDIPSARKWMSDFIATTALATGEFGVRRVLRIEKDFFDILLAIDYPLKKWLHDRGVDREQKRRFLRLKTTYPVLAGFEDTEIGDAYLTREFRYQNKFAHGLGLAYLLEALALSLDTDSKWDKSQIELSSQKQTATVYHASRPAHVRANAEWIKKQLEKDNPWLKHGLPRNGKIPYIPPRIYYSHNLSGFPTRMHYGDKGFLDEKEQIWIWDKQESHWDVQFYPYGRDKYFRVSPEGELLDDNK
jgi:hypothetical protein